MQQFRTLRMEWSVKELWKGISRCMGRNVAGEDSSISRRRNDTKGAVRELSSGNQGDENSWEGPRVQQVNERWWQKRKLEVAMDGLKYCELHQDTVQVSWQLLSPQPPPGAHHLIISMETTLLFYLSLIIFPTPNWLNHSLLFLKLCNVTKSSFFCILLFLHPTFIFFVRSWVFPHLLIHQVHK